MEHKIKVEKPRAILKAAGASMTHFFDASDTTRALFGATTGANMFMLGYAHQYGGVPVSSEAIEQAIRLNGEAVEMNIAAFRWGRRAAHDAEGVRNLVAKASGNSAVTPAATVDELIARRAEFLSAYQNAAYGQRYVARVNAVRAAEERVAPGATAVTEAVARSLFKLMAIKDEYEVGRLYSGGAFKAQLAREFAGFDRLEFHLAPPVLARPGRTGTRKAPIRRVDDAGVRHSGAAEGAARHAV
ncbi:MAG: hypothetical protein HC779_02035 [Phyllobacteriaceae bacterium]|nr:hypothetical protein [Phyllobacteriaceae bacterium]